MSLDTFKLKNNARSPLASSVTVGSSTIQVQNAGVFPNQTPFILTIWDNHTYDTPSDDPMRELVRVDGITGNTLTVQRGFGATSPQSHDTSKSVSLLLTEEYFNHPVHGLESIIETREPNPHTHIEVDITDLGNYATIEYVDAEVAASEGLPDTDSLIEELYPHNDATAIIKWKDGFMRAKVGNIRNQQPYMDYLRGAHVEIPEIPEMPDVEIPTDIYFVAAADAPDSVKERAHYVCTGTSDQTTINAAMSAMSGGNGGTLILSPGTYDITNSMSVHTRCTLSGCGLHTRLILNRTNSLGSNTPIVYVGQYATLQHLYINGGDAWSNPGPQNVGIRTGNYSTVQYCEIEEVQKYCCNDWKGTNAKFLYNIIHHTQYPVTLSGDTQKYSEGGLIHGNVFYNYGLHCKGRFARDYRVTNNLFLHDMANQEGWRFAGGDGPNVNGAVDGNVFIDKEGAGWQVAIAFNNDANNISDGNVIQNNVIYGFDRGMLGSGNNFLIQNNVLHDCRWAGVETTGNGVIIQNNYFTKSCIMLRNSNRTIVRNNRIRDASGHWRTADSGILLWGQYGDCTNAYIEGNIISDCAGHGIYISDEANAVIGTVIVRNVMYDNVGDNINDSGGIDTFIRGNFGWQVSEDVTVTAREGGRNIWVQSAAPTAVEVGDLWFQIEEEAAP